VLTGVLAGVYTGGSFVHIMPETGLYLVFTALLVYTAVRYLRAKPKQTETCTQKNGQE
jgi:uncharacterized protein